MRSKWILLDEINLELIKTEDGTVRMFELKDHAIIWAERYVTGWQVIEIPFSDE